MAARNLMIESWAWAQRYATYCASRTPSHVDRENLIGAGILGYVQAANRFNPYHGASFRGYCATRIKGAILDEMRRNTWESREAFLRRMRAIRRASVDDSCARHREPFVSLQEMEAASMTGTVAFEDNNQEVVGAIEQSEETRAMLEALQRMGGVDAKVLYLHYFEAIPFNQIAKALGVTPGRVSQLHAQGLVRMRKAISSAAKKECQNPQTMLEWRDSVPAIYRNTAAHSNYAHSPPDPGC